MSLIPVGFHNNITLYKGGDFQAVDSATIGKLLHPHSPISEKLVNRVYNRKKEFFSDKDTILIRVDTGYVRSPIEKQEIGSQFDSRCPDALACNPDQPGQYSGRFLQKREIRFFTIPYGVMKICKFSRSPYAIEVIERLFVLQEQYLKGSLPKPEPSLEYIAQIPPYTRDRGNALKEYAKKEGIALITARRRIARYTQGSPIKGKSGNKGMEFIQKKHTHKFETVIYFYKKGFRALHIAKKLSMCHTTVSRWIGKYESGFHIPDSNKRSGGIQ